MQYKIITSDSHCDLETSVTDYLKRGWRPLGAAQFVYYAGYREKWAQTMIKDI